MVIAFFGVSKPRQTLLGSELAGIVEAIGKDVTKFNVGDKVFAFTGSALGCYAEYKCMPEDGAVVRVPSSLTYHEAAAMSFGGRTAHEFVDLIVVFCESKLKGLDFAKRLNKSFVPSHARPPLILGNANAASHKRCIHVT